MKLSKYIATLLLIVPISVNAGPFGAVMGQSQESLDDVTVRDKGWVLFTPSKPHPV